MLLAFKEQNREELLKLSNPFYKVLKLEDSAFSSLGWILPDNIVLLRLNKPTQFGDDVSSFRPDIAQANIDHKQNVGYVVGKLGLEYKVTQPVTDTHKGDSL